MGLFDFAKNSLGDMVSGFGGLAQEHLEDIMPDARQAIDSVSNALDVSGLDDQTADALTGFGDLPESAKALGGEALGQASEYLPQAEETLSQFSSDASSAFSETANNLTEQLGEFKDLGGLGDIANRLFDNR